ncbi:SusC/RagA family TonB-linked outer membrane protein [Dyadobacter tibetensis]|uniref:SusC/RagA family TonB-linked outer membrane protein n=1 Tax=Dyadobacter tibetensis TaxID=1211851 RepID=UPI00046E798D|nr:TonB-dependent receptor [Dyadobacter tibetensis]
MKKKFTLMALLSVVAFGVSASVPAISVSVDDKERAKKSVRPLPGIPVSSHAVAQQPAIRQDTTITVKGQVKDENDEALVGVTVMVANSTIGTVTDIDGKFTLDRVGRNNILRFSFIGYTPQEVPIGSQSEFTIILAEDYKILDEIVVVGFGEQKKESVVGSIAQMSDEVIKRNGNVTDLKEALSGQLPGIVSITSSGEPGGITTGESATNIFIRGQNTWNGGQPLILVDNVERSMNNIDPNEVASISVLKDASATAVFGVKGANGVILITTKRGAQGKTKLNFNYTTTAKTISRQPDKLDSYAAMMAKNEIIEREGVLNEPSWNAYVPYDLVQRYRLPQSPEYAEIYPNVDWSKAMFKDVGFSHRATLSASGGSKAVQYFGSLAYLNEGDMFRDQDNGKGYKPNYDFNRFNFRSNIDVRVTKTTKLKLNFAGYYSQKNTNYNNEGSTSRADQWMWSAAYFLAPNLFLPRYDDGRWGAYQEGGNNTLNPLAVVYNLGVRQTRATQLNSDFTIQQDLGFLTKGLKASASLFYDNNIRSEGGIFDNANSIRPAEARTNVAYKQIYPHLYQGPDQDPAEYTAYLPVSDEEYDWILRPWTIKQEVIGAANWSSYIPITRKLMYQFQINYARQFKKHNVTAMALAKREESARGSMFKNYREDWVFRATYDYATRYLFEVNGAYNGSEQFGPKYRFDFFPSVGLGWVVSNEKFFKNPIMDHLKFRYSVGKVGDDNISGSRWLYASQLSYGGRSRLNQSTSGTSPYNFYRESVVGNPDIHWETAVKSNLGIEMGFFQNLLNLNVDIFKENRTNVLMSGSSRNVPPFFGTTPPSANLGQVKSKGYEIELKFNKRLNPNLSIWSNITYAHNQNTIIAKDDAPLQYDYLKAAGYSIGQNRSLIRSGFYNNWDEVYASVPTETNDLQKLPGYYNLVDFNGDGIIKNNEDTPPIGYTGVPQNTGTFGIGGKYKGFSMMVQLYGASNVNRQISFNNYQHDVDIVFGHVRDYWSADNPNASSFLPRWKTQAENIGDYYLYDASFLRLRTAELSYDFAKTPLLERLRMSNMRVFLSGTNLFFWSKLPDDREGTYSGGSATQGAYPTMRRFNLGIDFSF